MEGMRLASIAILPKRSKLKIKTKKVSVGMVPMVNASTAHCPKTSQPIFLLMSIY
jgi:hypothetical protein